MKCNILPRAVAAPPGTFDAVRNGLADVSYTVHGYTPGRFVTTQMAEMPFLGNSAEATSVAFQRIYAKYPAIADEHKGVKVLALFTHGPGIVFNTKRPITKVEDLSGPEVPRRRRHGQRDQQGAGHERHAEAGARELRAAVHRRDGRHPVPGRVDRGVQDRQGHPLRDQFPGGLYNTSFVFMMNQATYDKLPADGKKAIDELSGEFAARMFGRGWDKVDRRGMAFMQAAGVQFTKADAAFVKAVQGQDRAARETLGQGGRGQGPEGRRRRCWPSSAPRSSKLEK